MDSASSLWRLRMAPSAHNAGMGFSGSRSLVWLLKRIPAGTSVCAGNVDAVINLPLLRKVFASGTSEALPGVSAGWSSDRIKNCQNRWGRFRVGNVRPVFDRSPCFACPRWPSGTAGYRRVQGRQDSVHRTHSERRIHGPVSGKRVRTKRTKRTKSFLQRLQVFDGRRNTARKAR